MGRDVTWNICQVISSGPTLEVFLGWCKDESADHIFIKSHGSSEKNPGWLGYIGDYITQLYRDYNKPL